MIQKTMAAYVLHGERDLRQEARPVPQPAPDEVLIGIRQMGICGSDMHYFEHGRVGSFVPKAPFILGHEAAGEIVMAGTNVSNLTPGTRVAIDPSRPCGSCFYCRRGRYNLCDHMRYLGSASVDPHVDGAFCDYLAMPATSCHALPDHMSFTEGALIEPLSVGFHAIKRAGMIYGDSVLITGGGTIGQLLLLLARAFGAGKIAISDVLEDRRNLALAQGADATFDPLTDTVLDQMRDFAAGGFDLVIEASGAATALQQAIQVARKGGTIVQVGTLQADVNLPANQIMAKELSLLGSMRFANVFGEAISLVAAGRIDLQPLVSRIFAFDSLLDAMQLACSRGPVIKVHVRHEV